jgi:hypothetical protein
LESAKVEDALPPRRAYWQFALPENQHLLFTTGDITNEMAWTGENWLIERRPVMDQRQLEAWMKASRQPTLPRASNEYLIGSLGQWPAVHAWIGYRPFVVSVASGMLLVAGLSLIHIPRLRSLSVGFPAAVGIAAATLIAPHAAIVIAQAGLLGLATVLAAALFSWLAARPLFPSVPPMASASRSRESSIARLAGSHAKRSGSRAEQSSRLSATAAAAGAMEPQP